ncbi:MAG: DUF2914 domain-containing protein [Syntrophobacterales bacterium]
MRKLLFSIPVLVLLILCLGLQATSLAQVTPHLEVATAAICKDIVGLEPVDTGTSFGVEEGQLYCFTKITGANSSAHVTHVWYFDGTERARVDLPVNSIAWRTYSSKIIQPHELGAWHVDVLDSLGNMLKTLRFEVTP